MTPRTPAAPAAAADPEAEWAAELAEMRATAEEGKRSGWAMVPAASPDRLLRLLGERDRLRDELSALHENVAEIGEDRTATDPDDDWHRGFHEAARRLRAALSAAAGHGDPEGGE